MCVSRSLLESLLERLLSQDFRESYKQLRRTKNIFSKGVEQTVRGKTLLGTNEGLEGRLTKIHFT